MNSENLKNRFGILKLFDKALECVAIILGGLLLLTLTLLITVDVFMRYVLNDPIFGAQDISILFLISVVSLSIPYTARKGLHIFLELLTPILRPLGNRVADIIMRFSSAGVLGVMVWRLIHSGAEASDFGEQTQLLKLSFEPFYYILAVGFALYAINLVLEAITLMFKDTSQDLEALND